VLDTHLLGGQFYEVWIMDSW